MALFSIIVCLAIVWLLLLLLLVFAFPQKYLKKVEVSNRSGDHR